MILKLILKSLNYFKINLLTKYLEYPYLSINNILIYVEKINFYKLCIFSLI